MSCQKSQTSGIVPTKRILGFVLDIVYSDSHSPPTDHYIPSAVVGPLLRWKILFSSIIGVFTAKFWPKKERI
jgi:hypothetical protein